MDSKIPGDLVYVLGPTGNHLGGSEYYAHLGYVGLNVPHVRSDRFVKIYKALQAAISDGIVASAHGIYRGGLGIHLAMVAMGGNLGMDIRLSRVPVEGIDRDDTILFSESAGRLIVTIDPAKRGDFESRFKDLTCSFIGQVTDGSDFSIKGLDGSTIIAAKVRELKAAWKRTFGQLI
jgi:phosphoribosylformylglycinamidine synthase